MTWDPTGVTTGPFGGNGTWSTSVNTWYNGSTSGNAWSNGTGDTADLGSAAGTITVSGVVNAGTIDFDSPSGTAIHVQNGTINGPAGGTLDIVNTVYNFFTNNQFNNVTFTGAANYQFDGGTTYNSSGWTVAGNTFNGNVVLGNGIDNGELSWNGSGNVVTGAIVVNSGTGGGWVLGISGGTYTTTLDLNSLGSRNVGGMSFGGGNNTTTTWSGSVVLGADASIMISNGAGEKDIISGNISGNHNIYLGAWNAISAGNFSQLIISGTNNTYTGVTIVANPNNNAAITADQPVVLGVNNGLPVATTLVIGDQGGQSPFPGVASANSLINSGIVGGNWGNTNGAFDLHGFNQTVQGLATGLGQTASNQYIGNWLNSSTSTLTISGTMTNIAGGNGSFGGNITDAFGVGSGKLAIVLNGNGAPAALNLTGVNTYSAGTIVNSGTLTGSAQAFGAGNLTINPTGVSGNVALDAATVTSTGAIYSTAAVTVNTNSATAIGTLNFNDTAPAIGSLTGNGSVVLNNGSGTTLTIGANNASTTFSGVISQGSGTGSVTKIGSGTLVLNGANTYLGTTTVNAGILRTTVTSGTPFGTGGIALNSGTLSLAPTGSGSAVTVTGASATAGTQVTYGGGATLALNKGSQPSITFTAGNASPSGPVLARTSNGTLVIAPANGTASSNLGTAESFKVNGTAPTVTSGIVNPSIVGQNNDANLSGDFLTYSGGSGFVLATYGDSNFSAPSVSLTENVTSPETLGTSPTVYALRTSAAINAGANTLTIGNNSGQAGLILDGGGISNGTVAFGAAEGVVYTSLANSSISTSITGSGGLTTFGPGTLTLGGNNGSLTGGLNLNQGIVNVSADNNLGSASNAIKFNGGTLQFGAAFNPGGSRTMTVNAGGGTIDTNGNTITESGTISGNGALSIASTVAGGKLILTATNPFSGTAIINSGALQLGDGVTNNGSVAGAITDNSSLIFADPNAQTFSGVIGGTGTLTKTGAGTLTLAAYNLGFTGATLLNAGTLNVGNVYSLGLGGAITFGGGTLQYSSSSQTDFSGRFANSTSPIVIDTNGQNVAFLSSIASSNTGGLTKMGVGTLGLGSANNYTGGTTLNAGTINIANASAITPANGNLVINSGTLNMNAFGLTVGALSGNGVILQAGGGGAGFLTINSSTSGTFGGSIQQTNGYFPITKMGTGTEVFTGANTYAGTNGSGAGTNGTTINGGELALGNGGSLAASPVVVNTTGTFGVQQNANSTTNSIGDRLTLNTNSAFTMADGYTSTLTVTGAATLSPATGVSPKMSFDIGGATGSASDLLSIGGAVTQGISDLITINAVGNSALAGTYTFLTAPSGLTPADFTLADTRVVSNNVAYLISLTGNSTSESVVIGASGAPTLYWSGAQSSVWNTVTSGSATNWDVDAASGTNVARTPDFLTDVYFSTTNPVPQNLTNTLGTSTTINSLNFVSTSPAVTINADGSILTILAGTAANGINLAAGAAAQTINVPINLGLVAQNWTNNSSNTLTVGGNVNNEGVLLTVTGTGSGNTVIPGNITGAGGFANSASAITTLSGSNNYSGGTNLLAGELSLGSTNAIGTSGNITFSGGTLQFTGSNTTDYSARLTENGAPISIDTNGQNVTFASSYVGNSTVLAYGITKNGAGTLTITGNENNLSGPITINSGTLQQGYNNSSPWVNSYTGTTTPMYIAAGATFDLNGNADDSWEGAITGGGVITNTNLAHGATLLFGGTGTYTFAGSFLNGPGGLSLDYRGTGSTMILTGSSTIGSLSFNGNAPGDTINVATGGYLAAPGGVTLGQNTNGAFLNINGGYLTTGYLQIGYGGSGQLVINSGTLVATNEVRHQSSGAASITLNGGVLQTPLIRTAYQNGSPVSFAFNFNGGTVQATGNSSALNELFANFYNGNNEVAVTTGTGGAFIDTQNFNVSVMRPIANAASQVGGLTKLGTGTLTLGPAESYTGATTVSAGTLVLDYSQYASDANITPDSFLPSGAAVNIADGATFSIKGRPNGLADSSAWTSSTSANSTTQELTFSGTSSTSQLAVGQTVSGPGIPGGAYITQILDPYHFIINVPATSATTATMTIGAATFNPVNETFGNLALTSGTGTINLNANGGSGLTMTVTNGVTGAGALNETGNGLLILSGSGSYSGGTIINGGTLQIGNAFALGSTAANLAVNAGTLDLFGYSPTVGALSGTGAGVITTSVNANVNFTSNSASSGTFNGVIQNGSGQVGLIKAGSGTLTLGGASTYSGNTLINGGVLALNNANALGNTAQITFGGGTLRYVSSTTDYSGLIVNSGSAVSIDTGSQTITFGTQLAASNTGGLTVSSNTGNGVLILPGPQVYTGVTTINSGALWLGDGFNLDDSTLTSGTIADYASLVFQTAGAETYSGTIIGTGSVAMNSPGVQTLSGSSSYSGGTSLSGSGTLNYANVNALGTGPATFAGSAILQAGVAGTLANNLVINPSVTGTFDTQANAVNLTGAISGSGVLAKVGSGTLTLSASNSYTGGTRINAGILSLANTGALGTAGNIIFGGGTLQYTSSNTVDYSSRIASSGSAITIDTNGQNVTFSSAIANSNTGGLTKDGAGTLLLSVANNYSGPTIINGGILKDGVDGSIPENEVIVNSGGTWDINGQATYWVDGVFGNGLVTSSAASSTLAIRGNNLSGAFGGTLNNLSVDFRETNSTWTLSGSSNIVNGGFNVGNVPQANASTVTITGTMNTDFIIPGRDGGGTIIVNGGLIQASNMVRVGWGGPGDFAANGTFILNSGTVITPLVDSDYGTSSGALPESFQLNGGVLKTAQVLLESGSNPAFTFTMNGGTLLVSAAGTIFQNGGSSTGNEVAVQIGAGGGFIDTNGFNTTSVRPITDGTAGPGAFTKLGAGTLTLSSSNTYTGTTTVSAGTLLVSGSLSGTLSTSVAAGATLEVDGLLNQSAATTINGTLRGTGSTGPVTANGGTLAPGLTGANSLTSEGTLTAGGNVTLSSTTNFSIRLGMVNGNSGDNDQLTVSSGTVSLAGANLQLTIGSFLHNPADIGLTYVIINGGDTAGSGAFAQGSSITANGYTFNIIYDTNAAGGGFGTGNDVVLQLTAIPEAGTWASMIGGFGMLLVLQRIRRKARN